MILSLESKENRRLMISKSSHYQKTKNGKFRTMFSFFLSLFSSSSYVKEAVKHEREKARRVAAAKKPSVDFPSSSLSSTGVN